MKDKAAGPALAPLPSVRSAPGRRLGRLGASRRELQVQHWQLSFPSVHWSHSLDSAGVIYTLTHCWSSACAAALKPLTLVTHNGGCTPFIPAPTRPCTTTALLCCGLAPWAGCLLESAPACVRSVVLLRVGPTSNCSRLYRLSVEGRPEGRAGVHDQRSCTQPLNKWSPC